MDRTEKDQAKPKLAMLSIVRSSVNRANVCIQCYVFYSVCVMRMWLFCVEYSSIFIVVTII